MHVAVCCFSLIPNRHLLTMKPNYLKPLSFPVISVVFLCKTSQPRSLKAGGVRWLWCSDIKVPGRKYNLSPAAWSSVLPPPTPPVSFSLLQVLLYMAALAASWSLAASWQDPAFSGRTFLSKNLNMDHLTLASAPGITQSTAVGGLCSVGRLKTTCSFVLSPTLHGPLGKVCFLLIEECWHKHQYAVEFQAEKNGAGCSHVQCTHTSDGVRKEALVTSLLASYWLHLLSCCCMNIVHPETGRLLLNCVSSSGTLDLR